MCAGYGIGGGQFAPDHKFGIEPMDTHEGRALLDEWLVAHNGKANITGARALNLNPLIRGGAGGSRKLELGWWWLWLNGAGPVKFSAFNSRDDKLTRSWARPFQQRALLPATWYVEKKVRFGLPDDEAFGIAAVTNTVTDANTGATRITYSMVTRDAVGEAADTWHRMPMVLPASLHDEWLDPGRQGDEDLVSTARIGSEEISRAMIAHSA